jgi:hypothetical protein
MTNDASKVVHDIEKHIEVCRVCRNDPPDVDASKRACNVFQMLFEKWRRFASA